MMRRCSFNVAVAVTVADTVAASAFAAVPDGGLPEPVREAAQWGREGLGAES